MRETSLIQPVSAMERERTMRNLVDMQRKVEWKQQRGRERQLLRVRKVGVLEFASEPKWPEHKIFIQSFHSSSLVN